jgi:hypothetical protein
MLVVGQSVVDRDYDSVFEVEVEWQQEHGRNRGVGSSITGNASGLFSRLSAAVIFGFMRVGI